MRPRLVGSDVARSTMDHLLHADVMLPPTPMVLRPFTWVITKALRTATITTMPQWMRELSGFTQPKWMDAAITPVMRIAFWIGHLSRRGELQALRLLSPATVPVVAPILLKVPPLRAETLTPAEARERYGYAKPSEAHLEWRAKQRARVFDAHQAPSDAGLIESEPILGSLA
jgi:hypothetical protein